MALTPCQSIMSLAIMSSEHSSGQKWGSLPVPGYEWIHHNDMAGYQHCMFLAAWILQSWIRQFKQSKSLSSSPHLIANCMKLQAVRLVTLCAKAAKQMSWIALEKSNDPRQAWWCESGTNNKDQSDDSNEKAPCSPHAMQQNNNLKRRQGILMWQ